MYSGSTRFKTVIFILDLATLVHSIVHNDKVKKRVWGVALDEASKVEMLWEPINPCAEFDKRRTSLMRNPDKNAQEHKRIIAKKAHIHTIKNR